MVDNSKKPYKYVYNIQQGIWFIENGGQCKNIEINPSTNKIFFQFINSERLQELYNLWYARNK